MHVVSLIGLCKQANSGCGPVAGADGSAVDQASVSAPGSTTGPVSVGGLPMRCQDMQRGFVRAILHAVMKGREANAEIFKVRLM